MAFSISDAFDPEFLEPIVVRRQIETIGANGRATRTTQDLNVDAVVTSGSANTLTTEEHGRYMGKMISLVAEFAFQGPDNAGKGADHVIWHGSEFVVDSVDDYMHFGSGFTQATATSVLTTDPAPSAL